MKANLLLWQLSVGFTEITVIMTFLSSIIGHHQTLHRHTSKWQCNTILHPLYDKANVGKVKELGPSCTAQIVN